MAYSNNMTKLINKIERRLGVRALNLPENLSKDNWAEIIKEDTLDTFSRYFPHKIKMILNNSTCVKKDGYYIIDEDKFPGIEILGIKDICWEEFGQTNGIIGSAHPYGIYDMYASHGSLSDIINMQMAADQASLYNYGIYIDFVYPNKIALKNSANINITNSINEFPVDLLIKHSDNLNTISPTIMETFEKLAEIDIAIFLYQELKYYDGLDTVYGNIDLKISELEQIASRRDEVINNLSESYISASNDNQPMMFSV